MGNRQLVLITLLIWISVALVLFVIYWASRWGLASALAPWPAAISAVML